MKQASLKTFIIAIIMVVLVVGYYFHLSNKRTAAKEEPKAISEVDQVLLQDLDSSYPPSPKEVVKYYAAITKCFYDGQYTDDQLKKLAKKSRELFDDELKASQTDEAYLTTLKLEISRYKDNDIHVSSYSTSSSVDVDYKTTAQGDMAMLRCLFNLRQGSSLMTANQEFLLRKDKDGHWKILGWDQVKEDN